MSNKKEALNDDIHIPSIDTVRRWQVRLGGGGGIRFDVTQDRKEDEDDDEDDNEDEAKEVSYVYVCT